jgi:hypothetical protein
MSAVLYARVPDSLKHALHRHAAERGLTLTTRSRSASWKQNWRAHAASVSRRERGCGKPSSASRGLGSESDSPPAPTARSPSAPGKRSAPARDAARPCTALTCSSQGAARTAARRSPRCSYRRHEQTSPPTSTSAAGGARRPRRPRPRQHRRERQLKHPANDTHNRRSGIEEGRNENLSPPATTRSQRQPRSSAAASCRAEAAVAFPTFCDEAPCGRLPQQKSGALLTTATN